MAQSINLSVSGIYTSINDMNGLPPGALNAAVNIESRYKNVLEPRRGFEGLLNSSLDPVTLRRLINFYISGTDRVVALTSAGNLVYFTSGGTPWVAIPGDFSSGVTDPDSINAKARFIKAGQNLYITSQDGVRSLSSGSSAETLRAGVPKGLNLEAETNDDDQGFFNNNVVLATTGNLTSASAIVTNLLSTTGVAVDQYVTGIDVAARRVIQDLTYTADLFGVLGNVITIAYTTGGTAGSEVVTVVGNAISVQIQTGVSTATQVKTAVDASVAASALVSVSVSGTGSTAQTAPVAPTLLAGGLDNTIPVGTKVSSVTPSAPLIIETGDTTAGSATIATITSLVGIVAGVLVSGVGIPEGAKVSSTLTGPNRVILDVAAYQTATGVALTFSSDIVVTMDQNALASATGTPISFYSGAQVGYRIVFGRVETDITGSTVTRLGAPSSLAIANNISPYTTNVEVMATLPKNSDGGAITFYQLYRSAQTDSIDISPLDQYNLVYEAELVPADFVARVITITDSVPDSLVGIPLYSGSDREGILQANNPPPLCYDMCAFRDFTLFGNATQPTTLRFTIVSVGAPNGVQINDTITVAGTFLGVPFSRVYTGKASENQASQQFAIVTGGTPSQNITDTAASLIRVINYDEALPIHAILLSTTTDLPGQILLEADNPNFDTFTVTANLHTDAYDPSLTGVVSEVNTINNGIYVSKSGELEAVPSTNLIRAGDTSSDLLRMIPLRDYVVVLKTDGIYKLQGITPQTLVCNPFDLTTKIIGAETAVSLNSGVWMLSNQGVVSISDGGTEAKSIPIDDQLNVLIGSYLDNLTDVSFAVGYESDRKYILSVPNNDTEFTQTQFIYNYVTQAWTTWERNLHTAFVHSNDGKLYISRADDDDTGVSKERKTGTYRDYVDESISATISVVNSGTLLTMVSLEDIAVGDILYQSSSIFSPILEIDADTMQVTVQSMSWIAGSVDVLKAFEASVTWKQVFGDNPAFVRQFSEGLALFKTTRFNTATMSFVTDFSVGLDEIEIDGTGNGLWGILGWGEFPWGGTTIPQTIRFYIPQDKQLGSYLIPTLSIRQGYSDFKLQGLAITYYPVSQEVGK